MVFVQLDELSSAHGLGDQPAFLAGGPRLATVERGGEIVQRQNVDTPLHAWTRTLPHLAMSAGL